MKKIIIEHYAEKVGVKKNLICITPEEINNDTVCLTLLHGLSDNECAFLDYTSIYHIADKYNIVVLLPSGDRSFYTNMKNGINYYDYISEEIYDVAKKTLNINFDNMKHYIGGFSMGGYGAIKIALNSNKYAGVFAFAGVLDINSVDAQIKNGDGLLYLNEWQNVFGNEIDETDDVLKMNITIDNVLIVVGDKDFLLNHSIKFKETYGNKCQLKITENEGHDWFFVNKHLEETIQKLINNENL